MEENYQQNPDANMNEDGDGDPGQENHFFEGNSFTIVYKDFNLFENMENAQR